MKGRSRLAFVLAFTSMPAHVACVDGAIHGGELIEAVAVLPPLEEPDGGDAGPSPCDDAGDRGDGSAFSDLYRDFFGPTGLASCSARSNCHVPGGTGMLTSGYVCKPDAQTCWRSMTSTLVPGGGTSAPEETTLYKVLRKAPPTPHSGPMPRNSAFAFCPSDLGRIKAWIVAGAAND